MQVLRLYSKFVTIFMKSKLEYRLGFCVEILANFLMLLSYYLGIWVMFQNFDNIAGWNYQETLLLFNMNWLCYSISGFFLWAPMLNMGSYIQSGEFDSFLIRPMNTLVYLIFRQFQYTFIARLIMAIIFFTYSLQIISIPWTPVNIIYFIVCNSVQREHDKKLNNGLPILHMIPPYRDYGRYFCIMAEKGGTM